MESAIHQLDAALADYRRDTCMADVNERTVAALAEAAEAVLSAWDFDRGIPA